MAVLFSFAYLAAIFVPGTLGSYYLEGLHKPETARYVKKHFSELDDPRWLQARDFSHQHDHRHVPPVHSGSAKARRKPGVPTRRADQTWSREEDTIRRLLGYIPRRHEGPLNGHRRTVPLAKDEFPANDLWLLMPDDAGWNKGKLRGALLEGNPGRSEQGVGKNKYGMPEKEVEREADITTATETDITETVKETWMTSDLDKTVEESDSSPQPTTVTVKETASTARSPVDPKEMLSSTTTFPSSSSEIGSSSTWTVEDTSSSSMTILPSSEVTARKTVSSTPSTAGESSSEGISPSKTPAPSSTVTASETVSSTPTTASDSSSEGTSPSTSTVSLTPSTAEGSSSGATSPSTSTVAASETFSPTPSTTGGSSSSPDHVIVLPRIRTARIVLSSVLLALGLVAVAVAAVCIFRERRRKLKYDQLKLLP